MYGQQGKTLDDLKDFPTENHYVIIQVFGHPARTFGDDIDHHVEYRIWTDRAEWEAQIESMVRQNIRFRAFQAIPATIKTKVEVGLSG